MARSLIRKVSVIPEPHISDKNIENRIDYLSEIKSYMDTVRDIVLKHSDVTHDIVFAGDIFNRGFSDFVEYCYWNSYFLELRSNVNAIYSVIGNHEISFAKNNPFWLLLESIDKSYSEFYKNRSIKALGKFPIMQVVDRIDLTEEVVLQLGHHRMYPKSVEGKKNIGVFHNSILSSEIASVMKNRYDRDPLTGYIDYDYLNNYNVFTGYDYVFLGHMHKAYGLFTVEDEIGKTRLRYLASLGRTNVLEVNDNDLERVIPIIFVYDDGSIEIKEEIITLWDYNRTVDNNTLEVSKEKKSINVIYKDFIQEVDTDINPLEGIRESLKHEALIGLFDMSIAGKRPNIIDDMINKANRKVELK